MSNRLPGHICYLAGPMECVADNGADWRTWITPKLWDMGIGVFNPVDKPISYAHEDEEFRVKLDTAREEKNWALAHDLTKLIVGVDARMVNLSSFIILNIDKDVHMCGSYSEYTWSIQQRKPVLVHCKQGIKNVPGFVFGMNPPELLFEDWDSLLAYLRHIDTAEKVRDLKRWTFFDFNKVFGGKFNVV